MGIAAAPTTTVFYTLTEILKGSDYALTVFSDAEIRALKIFDKGGKPYLKCWATDRERPAKPEEIVRQLYLKKLIDHYGHAKHRLRIEKEVYFGSAVHEKRADIVVIERDTADTPYIIVECKKGKRKDGLEQLKSYCNAEGAPIGLWTNGSSTIAVWTTAPLSRTPSGGRSGTARCARSRSSPSSFLRTWLGRRTGSISTCCCPNAS